MAQIKEEYVSFETAKLLKEKGFNEETRGYYPIKGDATGRIMFGAEYHHNTSQVQIAAPTIQMAMKWLREVHNWTICISPYWPEGDMRNKLTWYYVIHSLIDNRSFRESSYTDNYTEASEAVIKYCLENLI